MLRRLMVTSQVRLQQVTVVNDRHALAAHEYWCRG